MCDCAVNIKTREEVRVANLEYQKVTTEFIDSGIYDTSDDFTVDRQPFMEHMKVPLTVEKDSNVIITFKHFVFGLNRATVYLIFHILLPIAFISVKKVTKPLLLNSGIIW